MQGLCRVFAGSPPLQRPCKDPAKTLQDPAKPQDGTFEPPRGGQELRDPPFFSHTDQDEGSKTSQKSPKRAPRVPQEASKRPQGAPKRAPRSPKEAPRCSKTAPQKPPNCLPQAPESILTTTAPEAPTTVNEAPKMAPTCLVHRAREPGQATACRSVPFHFGGMPSPAVGASSGG